MCGADNPYARKRDNDSGHNEEQQDEYDRIHMILLSQWSARHTSICDPCVLASQLDYNCRRPVSCDHHAGSRNAVAIRQ